jgi:hypothetical protein
LLLSAHGEHDLAEVAASFEMALRSPRLGSKISSSAPV